MNFQQLKYFISAARHLNFSETAKEFYMTQPAISHQIADLEKELGNQLFIRSAKGVALTKAGEMFLEDARQMLEMETKSKNRLQALAGTDFYQLTIGYLASPCKYFLPEAIHRFRQEYPQVNIDLIRMDAMQVLKSMDQGQYDIYFSLLEDIQHKRDYECRKIHADNYCLVCRNDHPCLNNLKLDYAKIAAEPFLMLDSTRAAYMTKQISQVCRDLGFVPRVRKTFQTMEEVLFAAEAGLGITFLPNKIKEYMKANLVYIPLDSGSAACGMGVSWQRQKDNPAVEWFMEKLIQYLKY